MRSAGCVYAEDEARLLLAAARDPAGLELLVAQRESGVPIEHILGWAEFAGLRVAVGPGVFVPRRRTRLLAREAIALAAHDAVVLDLCCGSGAVGAAVLAARPDVRLYAADLDATAVRYARVNLPTSTVLRGDLFDALPAGLRFAVIAANAPYVPTGEIPLMPPEARGHEAAMALDGGGDGLDVQRRVAAGAAARLLPGGHVLVEASSRQAAASAALFAGHGFSTRVVHSRRFDATVVVASLAV